MKDTRNAPVRREDRKPHVANAVRRNPNSSISELFPELNATRPELFRTERDVENTLHHYANDRADSSRREFLFECDKSARPHRWRLRDGTDSDQVLKAPSQIRRSPFEVLGINADAAAEVIVAAYRALARKYHPDVNRSLPLDDTLARMSELNCAKDELDRDLIGWRDKANSLRRKTVSSGRKGTDRASVMRSEEFDVHATLAEWLAGEGERILNRLIHEGGTYNFAIAAAGDYYVQFVTARGGTTFYVEAVSNKYLPRAKRLSKDRMKALQEHGFSEDGNFVLQGSPSASSATQIAATVLRDIYGVMPDSSLNVHVCFDDLFGDQFETP